MFEALCVLDMNNSVVKQVLAQAISELVDNQDILITTSTENIVLEKLFNAVQSVSPNLLSPNELGGIINALNAHDLGFALDDRDFQTIIGITKEELKVAATKLTTTEW